MTDEQITVAIAEACGWRRHEEDYTFHGFTCDIAMKRDRWTPPNRGKTTLELPNYVNDLNAMHEAEKVLLEQCGGDPQCELWIDYLANLVMAAPCCLREHATARQRAEAFLRTLCKWEEVKS